MGMVAGASSSWLAIVLRAAPAFVLPVPSLGRAGVSSRPGQLASPSGHRTGADLSAVGGDQEVNWGQGGLCLHPAAPLFTSLIFSPFFKDLGNWEGDGFDSSLLLLQFF